jgi:hypothetical protein
MTSATRDRCGDFLEGPALGARLGEEDQDPALVR